MTKQTDRFGVIAARAALIFAILWTTLPQVIHPRLIPNYCLEELYTAWNFPDIVRAFHHGPGLDDLMARIELNRGSSESAAGSLTFFLYLLPFFKVFGLGALGLNMAAFFINAALLFLAYKVGMRLFDERFTVILLAAMAASPWYRAIVMSRNYFGLSAFTALAACAVLLVALQRRERKWHLAAGLLVGLSIYSYVVYRVILIAAPLYCIITAILSLRRGPLDKLGLRLAGWLLLVILIVLGPSLVHPDNVAENLFTGDQESPFVKHEGSDEPPRSYSEVVDPIENARVMASSPNFWFHGDALHFVFLGLFALGAVLTLVQRGREPGLFLLYGLLGVGGIVFFAEWVTPSRVGGLFMPVFFIAAWGLRGVALGIERLAPRLRPWMSGALVSIAFFCLSWPSGRAFDQEAVKPNPWQNAAKIIERDGLRTSDLMTINKQDMRKGFTVYLEIAGSLTDQEVNQLRPYLQPVRGGRAWRIELPARGPEPYETAMMMKQDELNAQVRQRFEREGYIIDDAGNDSFLLRARGKNIDEALALLD